jgi:hypothetical protein
MLVDPTMWRSFLFVMVVSVVLNFVLFVFPIAKIVQRTGRSGWWSLLFFTGPGIVVGLYLLAYCRWPVLESARNSGLETL